MTGRTGWWRIVAMDAWDRDAVDLAGPGSNEFDEDGTGEFGFIAARGWRDCRWSERNGGPVRRVQPGGRGRGR